VRLSYSFSVFSPLTTIRLTEFEFGTSNNWAHERLNAISIQAMMRGDLGFSPDGKHLCVLPMLPRLMREARYTHH
jgi:hypothetical protein